MNSLIGTIAKPWIENTMDVILKPWVTEIDTTISPYLYNTSNTSAATTAFGGYLRRAIKNNGWYGHNISWDSATNCDYTTANVYLTGAFTSATSTYWYNTENAFSLTPRDVLMDKIRRNLAPSYQAKNSILMSRNNDKAELVARRLLHDMIGDEEFKRYLVRGFIMVKGQSGMLYKITGLHEMILVYKQVNGKYEPYERLCIVFKDSNLPFTDHVIMRKLLVDTDEFGLRSIANVFKIARQTNNTQIRMVG